MNWTQDRPTKRGVYWYTNKQYIAFAARIGEDSPDVVRIVFDDNDVGSVIWIGCDRADWLEDICNREGSLWCGPISSPAIPQ